MVVVTSAITRTEVLASKLSDDARLVFERFLLRSNVQEAAADPRITTLPSELRDYYQREKEIRGAEATTSAMTGGLGRAATGLAGALVARLSADVRHVHLDIAREQAVSVARTIQREADAVHEEGLRSRGA